MWKLHGRAVLICKREGEKATNINKNKVQRGNAYEFKELFQ